MRQFVYMTAFFAFPALSAPFVTNTVLLCSSGAPGCSVLANQSTTVNYSSTVTDGANSISLTAFADENLSTGALKTSDSYTEPSMETFYTQFDSGAWLDDTFTINAPGLAGTVGYLEIVFVLTGTASANGRGQITATLADPAGASTGTDGCPATLATCYVTGNATLVTLPMSFHYGTPFFLSWGFGADIFLGPPFLTGSADYSHTATIGLEVFNSANQLISNETVTAAGGEVIPLITTPEPESGIPVALCLVSVIAALGRRKRMVAGN